MYLSCVHLKRTTCGVQGQSLCCLRFQAAECDRKALSFSLGWSRGFRAKVNKSIMSVRRGGGMLSTHTHTWHTYFLPRRRFFTNIPLGVTTKKLNVYAKLSGQSLLQVSYLLQQRSLLKLHFKRMANKR